MKIISQFRKLKQGSKIALRFRKYPTEVFCGIGRFDFGVEISISNSRPISKEYEKFSLITEQRDSDKIVVIKSNVESEDELEVFAYLIEYVLFELGKKSDATTSDIKKYIDDWLLFSSGKAPDISVVKQIGIIGELLIFSELSKEFPDSNQLNNWHGPEGAKIDFIFNGKLGLEVKSRIQPFKDWINISSSEQLDNDLDAQYMAVCDFLPSDTGKTLRQFVDEVITILDDRDMANELIVKLRKADYDYFLDNTNLIKVVLFKQSFYDTKSEEFPILKKGTDLRIAKIRYEINIAGLKQIYRTELLSKICLQC